MRNKEVPYFARYSEKSKLESASLTNELKEFNAQEILHRSDNVILFLLLDRYSSHAELEFIKCANKHSFKSVAYLGMLHRTMF